MQRSQHLLNLRSLRLSVGLFVTIFLLLGQFAPADEKSKGAAEIVFKEAVHLYENGDLKGAIDKFRVGMRLDDQNPAAHYFLAKTYEALEDPTQAVIHYRLAYQFGPDSEYGIISKALLEDMGVGLDRGGAIAALETVQGERRTVLIEMAKVLYDQKSSYAGYSQLGDSTRNVLSTIRAHPALTCTSSVNGAMWTIRRQYKSVDETHFYVTRNMGKGFLETYHTISPTYQGGRDLYALFGAVHLANHAGDWIWKGQKEREGGGLGEVKMHTETEDGEIREHVTSMEKPSGTFCPLVYGNRTIMKFDSQIRLFEDCQDSEDCPLGHRDVVYDTSERREIDVVQLEESSGSKIQGFSKLLRYSERIYQLNVGAKSEVMAPEQILRANKLSNPLEWRVNMLVLADLGLVVPGVSLNQGWQYTIEDFEVW